MKKILVIFFLLVSAAAAFAYKSPFEVVWDVNAIRTPAGKDVKTDVIIRIPSGHFLYKDKTEILFTALEGIRVKSVEYPQGVPHEDSFAGKKAQIFPEGEAVIPVVFSVPPKTPEGRKEISAILEFQGCEEKLCLRPEKVSLLWKLDVSASEGAVSEGPDALFEKGEFSVSELINARDFKNIVLHGRLVSLLIAFIAGLFTSLTPCVWPLIPVTLLIIGIHKKGNFAGNLALSVCLVAGMSLTYAVLGVAAAAVGSHVGFLFQEKIFLVFVVVLLVLMSLSLFGVFTIELPRFAKNALARLGGSGYRGAFLSGVSLGLLATPCVGPLLAPMLLWVAAEGEYVFGVELLTVYSFGMGAAYVIIGTFYGAFAGRVRSVRIGGWIKKILGVLLLVPAVYYLSSVIPHNGFLNGEINWRTDEAAAVAESAASGKPMMIVFGAKWCPPCLAFEKNVLGDREVAEALRAVVLLHVDATIETEDVSRVVEKYRVIGWPTILFVSPDGRVYDDLKVVGDVPDKEEFIGLVKKAAER